MNIILLCPGILLDQNDAFYFKCSGKAASILFGQCVDLTDAAYTGMSSLKDLKGLFFRHSSACKNYKFEYLRKIFEVFTFLGNTLADELTLRGD